MAQHANLSQLMDLIDTHKESFPNWDYVKMCNIVKTLFNYTHDSKHKLETLQRDMTAIREELSKVPRKPNCTIDIKAKLLRQKLKEIGSYDTVLASKCGIVLAEEHLLNLGVFTFRKDIQTFYSDNIDDPFKDTRRDLTHKLYTIQCEYIKELSRAQHT
mgnify:CR=1 FL=1